jgi:hypothetical protein
LVSGVIMGHANGGNTPTPAVYCDCAVRWTVSGTVVEELGSLGKDVLGYPHSYPKAINSAGTIAGCSTKYDNSGNFLGTAAVRWDASRTVATELDHTWTDSLGYFACQASAINDAGTIVGDEQRGSAGTSAIRWNASGTAAQVLDDLDMASLKGSWASKINSGGIIVGGSSKGDNLGNRAVRWDAVGTAVHELGSLGTDNNGYTESWANDINSSGQIVGAAYLMGDSQEAHAVLWDAIDIATDLNTLIDPSSGWLLNNTYAITDSGWILGDGMFDPDGPGGQDAYYRLFLIRVPEPNLTILLAAAIFSVFLVRRTQKGKQTVLR